LFDFRSQDYWGTKDIFSACIVRPLKKNGDRARAEALSARLAPFLLRRTKDSVAKELPPKVEIIESITLDEKQRDFYDGVRLAMHQRILEVVRQQGLARSQINYIGRLVEAETGVLRPAAGSPFAAGRLLECRAGEHAGGRHTGGVLARSLRGRARHPAKLEWLSTVLPELVSRPADTGCSRNSPRCCG